MRMNNVKPRASTNGFIGMASAGFLSVIPPKSYHFGWQDSRALTIRILRSGESRKPREVVSPNLKPPNAAATGYWDDDR
jgi:hypothetical protein